jgi:hypothetical protein
MIDDRLVGSIRMIEAPCGQRGSGAGGSDSRAEKGNSRESGRGDDGCPKAGVAKVEYCR